MSLGGGRRHAAQCRLRMGRSGQRHRADPCRLDTGKDLALLLPLSPEPSLELGWNVRGRDRTNPISTRRLFFVWFSCC